MASSKDMMQQEVSVFVDLQLAAQEVRSASAKSLSRNASGAGSVQLVIECGEERCIYDQYSKSKRWLILAIVSITAIVVPLCGEWAQVISLLSSSRLCG